MHCQLKTFISTQIENYIKIFAQRLAFNFLLNLWKSFIRLWLCLSKGDDQKLCFWLILFFVICTWSSLESSLLLFVLEGQISPPISTFLTTATALWDETHCLTYLRILFTFYIHTDYWRKPKYFQILCNFVSFQYRSELVFWLIYFRYQMCGHSFFWWNLYATILKKCVQCLGPYLSWNSVESYKHPAII